MSNLDTIKQAQELVKQVLEENAEYLASHHSTREDRRALEYAIGVLGALRFVNGERHPAE